jgi:hypothetical protein
MTRVGGVPPVGFWGLWCPSAVEVGAGKDGYAVDVVGEGFDYAGGGMAVVELVGEGFDYAVRPCALAGGGCPGCIASLRALLAPC